MSQAHTKDSVYFTAPDSPVLPDKFDCRVRRRHLTRGILNLVDLQKHQKSLPDEAAVAEFRDYDTLIDSEDNDSDGVSNSNAPMAGSDSVDALGTTH